MLQDLPGPKLRIGALRDGIAELKPGDDTTFVCGENSAEGDARRMYITWAGLADTVDAGEIMYLADGTVRLRVTATRPGDGEIDAVVEVGGSVASRQGLNIPGETAALPSVPEEDLVHLRVGERIGVDLVALSFVRRAEDVTSLRKHTRLPLIAKIEKPQAVHRAEEIVRAADCVMVARGDLGIEMRIEEVPIVQKQVIALAGALARPSITATQMLDSMVASSRPTRAEVTDVANAILDGTDAVMLSQESAVGAYPVESDRDARRGRRAHRDDRALRGVEREARPPRSSRPRLHDRLQRVPRRPRAGPRGAGVPDALGALGEADLLPPPDRADLRPLPRPRDRPALRPDVGRAGGVAAALRDHGGTDRRVSSPGRGAGMGQARAADRDHGGAAERKARHDQPVPGPRGLTRPGYAARLARTSRATSRSPSVPIPMSTATAITASGARRLPSEPPSAV